MLPDGYIQRHKYVPPPPHAEQRVDASAKEQKVAHPMTRITDAPPIITAPNPTAPRKLKQTARTHSGITRHNIPGSTPPIVNIEKRHNIATNQTPSAPEPIGPRRLTRNVPHKGPNTPKNVQFIPIEGGVHTRNFISQEAITFLTECVWEKSPDLYTPAKLCPNSGTKSTFNFQQVAMPMVHTTTGETISSYKQLMHDPDTAETWQTAFGKDFGGTAQGDQKTGQKGTNSIFVMTHDEIKLIP
jgi:hypothetical protein